MDNLTHTLIGLAAGELATRITRSNDIGLPEATRRTALLCIGMIGGNLPDIDLLWSYSNSDGSNLAYILEHRGYTHTLLGCAALALMIYGVTALLLRWRQYSITRQEHGLLAAFSLISVLLHLGMDALNSYGVHPFWPFNNKWYYGDAVFIVEPLYWVMAAPLLFSMRSGWARMALVLVLLIGNVAILLVHRFELSWLLVPVLTAALVLSGRYLAQRKAAITSALLMLMLTFSFLGFSAIASSHLQTLVQQQFPGYNTLDQVMTPSPAQPLCWDVIVLQRKQDEYKARSAQLSLVGAFGAAVCPQLSLNARTVESANHETTESSTIRWDEEAGMSLSQFNKVVADDCQARAALQFIRAPMLTATDRGLVLSDLRFSRVGAAGLGSVLINERPANICSHHVPWSPPRAELLN